jgi:hypothetical protein
VYTQCEAFIRERQYVTNVSSRPRCGRNRASGSKCWGRVTQAGLALDQGRVAQVLPIRQQEIERAENDVLA